MLDHNVFSATIEQFENQMSYLHKHCNVLSLDELLEHREKRSLPRNSVIVTFDDGYKDNYLYAYPILKKYNLAATVFLTTGYINRTELLWWDKVAYLIKNSDDPYIDLPHLGRVPLINKENAIGIIQNKLKTLNDSEKNNVLKYLETEYGPIPNFENIMLSWLDIEKMIENNISFGSHTVRHPILTRVSLTQARAELINSKIEVEQQTGKEVIAFAYPNGKKGDFDESIIHLLKSANFRCAVTTIYGLNNQQTDLFKLRRVCVQIDDDQRMFKIKLLGFGRQLLPIYEASFG